MKTTFIFLACLLGITAAGESILNNRYPSDYWANRAKSLQKDCNNKTEEISTEDCKQECKVAKPGEDCAKCIAKHKDYDFDCKGYIVDTRCLEIGYEIFRNDCKDQCLDDSNLDD